MLEEAYSQMTRLVAVVAATTPGSSAAQSQSRAVGLDVAETLAMVALLGLSRPRERALVGLMAGLLACQSVRLSAEISTRFVETNSCSIGALQTSRPRHSGQHCHTCSRHDETETS